MRSLVIACLFAPPVIAAGCKPGGADNPAASSVAAPVHEDSIVTADSVKLYYRVVGTGGETVVAPLALFHTTRLDPLARGRRLVLYDPRGRGRSDTVPPSKVSLDLNLSDLDAIRTAVGAERIALIGWSGLGMELFVYTLKHPDRVSRLVQLAPVAPRWIPYAENLMADRRRRTDDGVRRKLEARLKRGEFDGKPAEECRARAAVDRPATLGDTSLSRATPDVCVYPTEWPPRIGAYFGALLRSIEGFDWTDSLSRVARIPRLVIHGERDNTPIEGNREWVTHQPNARLLVIPGAGHWPHYEQPDLTLRAIDSFLRGEWPAGSLSAP